MLKLVSMKSIFRGFNLILRQLSLLRDQCLRIEDQAEILRVYKNCVVENGCQIQRKPYYMASSQIDTLTLMNEYKGTNWLHWRKNKECRIPSRWAPPEPILPGRRSRTVWQAKQRPRLESYHGSHAGGLLLPLFAEQKSDAGGTNSYRCPSSPSRSRSPSSTPLPVHQVLASKIKQLKALGMTNQEIADTMKIGRKTVAKGLTMECSYVLGADQVVLFKRGALQ